MSDNITTIKDNFSSILSEIGEDLNREGLVDTPNRAAKAILELTAGYHQDLESLINGATFSAEMNEMVIIKDIEFYSLCEHHMLPFFGKCHIAYIPDEKILGLSKFARLVDHFARRLQIQEGLTKQIAEAIIKITQPRGVSVIIEAQHFCMMMRGVQKQQSKMKTSTMLGEFKTCMNTRNEFLQLIKT